MRNDEIIRELSDVELEKVTGAYYCVDSSGRRTSCSYTSFDLGEDIVGAMSWAVAMAKPYY